MRASEQRAVHVPASSDADLAAQGLAGAVFRSIVRSRVDEQAAQIAFNAVFSLAPLFALTMALSSALPARLGARFHDTLLPYVPVPVRPLLGVSLRALLRSPDPVVIVLSLLGLLWSLSSSTNAVSTAMGHVGWALDPSWFRRRLRAGALGLLLLVGLALSAVAAAIGPRVLRVVAMFTTLPLDRMLSVAWVRWPAAGLVFGMVGAMFVWVGTVERPRLPAVLAGGVAAGTVSVSASMSLGLYLSYAGYAGVYGAAGAVFAALLWLFVLASGLLVGAVVAYVVNVRGLHWAPLVSARAHLGTHEPTERCESSSASRIRRPRPRRAVARRAPSSRFHGP